MLPAHQLETGETVAAASLDEPGYLYVPRLNLQATQGFGGGDLSANVSGTVEQYGGGITGRYYLNEHLNAELQIQGTSLFHDSSGLFSHSWDGMALLGIQEAATDSEPLYVGVHGGGIGKNVADARAPFRTTRFKPALGGSVGYASSPEASWSVQVEMEAVASFFREEKLVISSARLSIGLFRIWE